MKRVPALVVVTALACSCNAPERHKPPPPDFTSTPPAMASSAPAPDVGRAPVVGGKVVWVPYSNALADAARFMRRPVFVRIDAEWDINSMVNRRRIFDSPEIRRAFEQTGVMPAHADCTDDNPAGEALLGRFNRGGVPVYGVLLPEGEPIVLPQVIDAPAVVAALHKAAARFPAQDNAASP